MSDHPVTGRVLPEGLRQQYLSAMGIQSWYDPFLDVELLVSAGEAPRDSLISIAASPESNLPDVTPELLPVTKESVVLKADQVVTESPLNSDVTPINTSIDIRQVDTLQKDEHSANQVEITTINALHGAIEACQLCGLHTLREQTIYGEGNETADCLVLIDTPVKGVRGEYALFIEEHKKLLQAMLQAIGLSLSSVYITSLVKCCPEPLSRASSGSRAPHTSEMVCCDVHLAPQINLIRPQVILVLGEVASQQLLASQKALPDLRLRFHQYAGVPVVASYHPFELLNSAATKRKVWADLLQIQKYLTGSEATGRAPF